MGHARRADGARQDGEPLPERRLPLRRAALALRLHAVRVLHGVVWGLSCYWCSVAGLLGPRAGAAPGKTEVAHDGLHQGLLREEVGSVPPLLSKVSHIVGLVRGRRCAMKIRADW